LNVRYYVYRGRELAVTFQYGRRPIYHGTLGQQVKALLAVPDASLVTAGFRFVADDGPGGRGQFQPHGDSTAAATHK
jgi:hypothetical protein